MSSFDADTRRYLTFVSELIQMVARKRFIRKSPSRMMSCFWLLFGVAALGQPDLNIYGQEEEWSEDRIQRILAPPTPAEINAVVQAWQSDGNEPTDITLVESGEMTYGNQIFTVSVFRYAVSHEHHFAAIYVPKNATDKSLPILVEIRGVRYDYPPRVITDGSFGMSMLGEMVDEFILVEPSLRGHELQAIEQMQRSDGDRRDSWDGAADDAVSALSVAIAHVKAWDGKHVFSFGLSRGGTVALLHGQRDDRVTGVVAMSAPTDWTRLMARPYDDWSQRIHLAARNFAKPTNDRAAQFYEWFMQDREDLPDSEIRRRLIASSPLYFAKHLPPTILHQGTRDSAIPSINAAAMNDRFLALDLPAQKYRVIFHEGKGHLLLGAAAHRQSRAFLRSIMDNGGEPVKDR